MKKIGEYIAEDSASAARRVVAAIKTAGADLATFPTKFPVVGTVRGRPLRRRPCGGYLMFYSVGERSIEIVRIRHSARDHERILFPED